MAEDGYVLQARLSRYLGDRYDGGGAVKRLARDIDADTRTARNILAGHWPGARHWRAIIMAFGHDVIEAVFAPDIDEVLARQEQEIKLLEAQLEIAKARHRARAGARKAVAAGAVAPSRLPAD